jgi:hypothetical protein
MQMHLPILGVLAVSVILLTALVSSAEPQGGEVDQSITSHAQQMLTEGQQTFRHDTFGSEAFWGGALKLHQAIAGAAHGGTPCGS